MRFAHSAKRRAFSLLEMVLALAIGMLLLLALYVAFNTYITQAQSGREIVNEASLARNIMLRIGSDVFGQLGPVDTRVADYSGAAVAATGGAVDPTSVVSFNNGVYGTGATLILSNYRVHKSPANAPTNAPDAVITSDVQRTAYWMVMNGPEPVGLARAEIKQATSLDSDLFDPTTLTDPNKYVIAPEVKSIQFEYFDGTTWLPVGTTWDGSFSASTDGSIPPQGPPAAIRITLMLKRNTNPGAPPDDPTLDGPSYLHVIALPTSNSFPPQTSP
jgi:hypothetical protein